MSDTAATIKKNLELYSQAKMTLLSSALQEHAENMLQDAKSNYVPYDPDSSDEHLRDTGKVLEPEISGSIVSIKVQFGGTPHTSPYAISTHETPSQYDPPTWKGKTVNFRQGGAKYLELPFKKSLSNLLSKLAEKVRM